MCDARDPQDCLSPLELRDFGQGRLPDRRSQEIESHLEVGCAECSQAIAAVEADDDGLVASLRYTGDVGPVPDSALERLRSTLTELAGEAIAEMAGLGVLAGDGGRIHIDDGGPVWSGGNGRISVAVDLEIGRPAAIKRPVDLHNLGAGLTAQILKEARVTGSLEHRGIVPIHGLGKDAHGHPCFAMRLIRGVTLKSVIRRFHAGESLETILGRVAATEGDADAIDHDTPRHGTAQIDDLTRTARDLRELLHRFRDVCEVLTYAHNRRVVHLAGSPTRCRSMRKL